MCKRKVELSKDQEWELFNFVLTTTELSGNWESEDQIYYYELNYHPIGYTYITQFCLVECEELSDVDFDDVNDMLVEEWYR